jgi:DNA invertase Pin-like site-specific DNA recombinase
VTDNKQKRTAIYARTATLDMIGPNNVLAEQIIECRKYGTGKGYEIVEEYQEIGSGNNINREILTKLLLDAQENKFDILVVKRFDRLARDQSLLRTILDKLKESNVEVESTQEVFSGLAVDTIISLWKS